MAGKTRKYRQILMLLGSQVLALSAMLYGASLGINDLGDVAAATPATAVVQDAEDSCDEPAVQRRASAQRKAPDLSLGMPLG